MIGALNTVAQTIGYVILGLIGIGVVGSLLSTTAARSVSPEAREVAEDIEEETGFDAGMGALLAQGVLDGIEDIGDDCALEYEPRPVASFDWSARPAELTEDDIRKAGGGLRAAGFHVHPFPRSPDDMLADEWHWSDGHIGVWLEEPTFFIKTEDGREVVETDLSEWQPDAGNSEN